MASTSRESIARKQRTTLRNGQKLIDALRSGPKTSFTTNSSFAHRPFMATPQNWKNTFSIGQTEGDSEKPIVGQMFKMMYENKLELPDEPMWNPVKPLGNGSYGAAALFKHEDELGNADDYVVAKYTECRKTDMVRGWRSHISQEAAMMMQLNELQNDGILFLREFRYFADTKRHVYFTEYCPNFDLEMFRLTHRAMKRHIPEALIWYLFYALAKGLVAMEQGPFGAYATPHEHIPGAFLIHRDIKPSNTFLGFTPALSQPLNKSDPGYVGAKLKYPHAKIADFGLSQITTLGDEENIASNHTAGTAYWFPPEVRVKKFDRASAWYPFGGTCYDQDGNLIPQSEPVYDKALHAYTPAGNMFVVGFMIYQLITLDEPEDMTIYLDRIMYGQEMPVPMNILNPGDVNQRFSILDTLEDSICSGFGITDTLDKLRLRLYGIRAMLIRWETAKYDPVLKSLVENCMAFLPEQRISAVDLLAELEALLPYYWQTLEQMRSVSPAAYEEATRAFTTEADLPNMEPGTANIELDARFWRRLVRGLKWLDVTAGNIRPPMDPNDSDIPEEAWAMFAPGRKEEKNRLAEQRGQANRIALSQDVRFRNEGRQQDEDGPENQRGPPESRNSREA